jgi:peptidoglycan/LPS O-acetylase OafA/YrhL
LLPERHRYAPLDGLRGLAIAAVFAFHYRMVPNSPGEWGWAGVDLFFVLSGFLITGILFDSLGEDHYFRNFYIRRALRIFPLYWGLWLAFIAVMLVEGRFEAGYLAWPAYVGNYLGVYSLAATPNHQDFETLPAVIHIAREHLYLRLGPYWSLCVEEQYYLAWPLAVWAVRRRERLLILCLAGIAGVLALRTGLYFVLPASWIRDNALYFWTFTRVDSLLAGSALALWVRGQGGTERLATRWIAAGTGLAVAGLGAAGWRWGLFNGNTFAGWMQIWGLSLVWLTACGVLALSLRPGWLARGLAFKPLAQLGRVSYGFYLFHLLFYDCDRIVIDAIKPGVPAWPVHLAIFGWVWLLSWASFRWYEMPFLRLKSRWGGGSENRKAVPAAEARARSSVP